MRITSAVGSSSSGSHRNVDAVDLSVSAAVDGAKVHQNIAPVEEATSAVQDTLMEIADFQPDAAMSNSALQSRQDVDMDNLVVVDSYDTKNYSVEEVDKKAHLSQFTSSVQSVSSPLRSLLGLNRSQKFSIR